VAYSRRWLIQWMRVMMTGRLSLEPSHRWKHARPSAVCHRWHQPMLCCRVFSRMTPALRRRSCRLQPNTRSAIILAPCRSWLQEEIDRRDLTNYTRHPDTLRPTPGIPRGPKSLPLLFVARHFPSGVVLHVAPTQSWKT